MELDNMTEEQAKELGEKINNNTATPEEELALLKYLNNGVDTMRAFIKDMPKSE